MQLGGINRYHQHFRLKAWHINSVYAPLNCDDARLLSTHINPINKNERQLMSASITGVPKLWVFSAQALANPAICKKDG